MGTIFPYVEGLKFRKGVEMSIYVSVNDLTVAALEDFTFFFHYAPVWIIHALEGVPKLGRVAI